MVTRAQTPILVEHKPRWGCIRRQHAAFHDGDGFGDNPEGYQPDSCPETFTSRQQIYSVVETAMETVGLTLMHSLTIIPNGLTKMATATVTQDGLLPDSCPTVFGNSTIQRYGCLDSDGDGLMTN